MGSSRKERLRLGRKELGLASALVPAQPWHGLSDGPSPGFQKTLNVSFWPPRYDMMDQKTIQIGRGSTSKNRTSYAAANCRAARGGNNSSKKLTLSLLSSPPRHSHRLLRPPNPRSAQYGSFSFGARSAHANNLYDICVCVCVCVCVWSVCVWSVCVKCVCEWTLRWWNWYF
jgi:hypothetical protein